MKPFLWTGAVGAVAGLVGFGWANHAGITTEQGIPLLMIGLFFGVIIGTIAAWSA